MFDINGRRICVKRGTGSQTINVCSAQNQLGNYDYVVRCRPAHRFTDQSLQDLGCTTVEALVEQLRNSPGCDVEREPSRRSPSEVDVDRETQRGISSPWDRRAVDIIGNAIDQLVLDFIEYPYLHRVEHSIHCELFRILKSCTMFATTYAMGHYQTQCVHKEWPRRGTSDGGNIDLCILSPDDVKTYSLRDFRKGHPRPAIGIEIGLDYNLKHLQDDDKKLKASKCRRCFLVHLVREDVKDNFNEVEKFLSETTCTTAYARIDGDRAMVKLVNDAEVRPISRRKTWS